MRVFRTDSASLHRALVGVGGIGTGSFFELEGNQTLGRNESRPGRLLDVRDYCKLHIVTHYVAKLLGAGPGQSEFHIVPIGKVGADAPGQSVRVQMQEVGMDTRFITTVDGKPTLFSVCFQYPDGSGGNITTSNSAAAELSSEDVDAAAGLFGAGGRATIALAVPEVPLDVRCHLLAVARGAGAFCTASFVSGEILSAKQHGMFQVLDLVALNESEAAEFVDCPLLRDAPEPFITECLSLISRSYPGLRLIVSAGERGAYGFSRGVWNFCPAPAVRVCSTAGAGDALFGGVISALATGMPFVKPGLQRARLDQGDLSTALEFGVMLASYTVASPHTIHPDACLEAVLEFSAGYGASFAPEFRARLLDKEVRT
jgi:sugar/nucleoside kinase (ribokinase family)